MNTTEIKFGLMDPKTNKLVGYSTRSNTGGYACNESRVELEDPGYDYPEWLVDEVKTLRRVMAIDTPWYNSDKDSPMHRSLELSEFIPVRVIVNRKVETVDVKPAPVFPDFEYIRDLDVNKVPLKVVCRPNRYYSEITSMLPANEFEPLVGKFVLHDDGLQGRYVEAVYDEGEKGCRVICSNSKDWSQE